MSISHIRDSKAFAGETELLALVYIIKFPITVHYENAAGQTLFVEAYQDSPDTVHLLNYSNSDKSPGHYDILVTEEKQEGHQKICLRRAVT